MADGRETVHNPTPPPDAHATLVVVGPGDQEQQYAFDALIDDTDGEFVPTTVQYVNNDILTDCILPKGFKELSITCGDMNWILTGAAVLDVSRCKRFKAEPLEGTTAAAVIEIDACYGDGASPDDISVTALIIQASADTDLMEDSSAKTTEDPGSRSLGNVTFKFGGKVHVASCLPFGRIKAGNGQVFDRVDAWLQSIQRSN